MLLNARGRYVPGHRLELFHLQNDWVRPAPGRCGTRPRPQMAIACERGCKPSAPNSGPNPEFPKRGNCWKHAPNAEADFPYIDLNDPDPKEVMRLLQISIVALLAFHLAWDSQISDPTHTAESHRSPGKNRLVPQPRDRRRCYFVTRKVMRSSHWARRMRRVYPLTRGLQPLPRRRTVKSEERLGPRSSSNNSGTGATNSSGYVLCQRWRNGFLTWRRSGPRDRGRFRAGEKSRYTDVFESGRSGATAQASPRGDRRPRRQPLLLGYVFIDLPVWHPKPKRGRATASSSGARTPARRAARRMTSSWRSAEREIQRPMNEPFLNRIADIYYHCVVGELRNRDPHHLVLGDRLMALPEWHRIRSS